MTGKKLFQEIGMIKEEYIVEAEEYKRSVIHNVVFNRTLAGAVCLVICLGLYWGVWQVQNSYEESAEDTALVNQTVYESAVVNESLVERIETDTAVTEEVEATETVREEMIVYLPKESASEPEVEAASPAERENLGEATGNGAMASDSKVVSQQANKEELYKYLTDAGMVFETDMYVIIHGQVKNGQNVWDDFLEKVEVHEATSIDIIQFTLEGDPIISNLQFNGMDFTVVRDNTLDSFAGSGAGVTESTYKYMNLLQGSDYVEVILSQEAGLTKEQLYSGDYEAFHLIQYEIAQ